MLAGQGRAAVLLVRLHRRQQLSLPALAHLQVLVVLLQQLTTEAGGVLGRSVDHVQLVNFHLWAEILRWVVVLTS